jgi:hypothetical protein
MARPIKENNTEDRQRVYLRVYNIKERSLNHSCRGKAVNSRHTYFEYAPVALVIQHVKLALFWKTALNIKCVYLIYLKVYLKHFSL